MDELRTSTPTPPDRLPARAYNFEHFLPKHLWFDMRRTFEAVGIPPGSTAPSFELPRADGGKLSLSSLRGRPVLLRFGSFT